VVTGWAKRTGYTAVVGAAIGIVVYMTCWVLLTVVELVVLLYLGQEEEVPIPPPGDIWLRAPVLLLAVGGGLWVARRAWDAFSIDPRLLPGASRL
jgi:H+/Cl- antiporter ClcA